MLSDDKLSPWSALLGQNCSTSEKKKKEAATLQPFVYIADGVLIY